MAAKLALDKHVSREIQLRILPKSVVVTVSAEGVTVAAKRHKGVNITWSEIINHSSTPPSAPAKFYKMGYEYLSHCMK